jgi:hypothetical protein
METKINASSTMFLNRKANKVGTGKKMISMVNAVLHGTRPQRFKARFMMPGLTNYPSEDGTPEMWWLPREVMTKMQKSFIGCPVVLDGDHNGNSTPENFEAVAVGVVSEVWTGDDGWDWCNMIIWDQETIDKIQKGWNVSCAYNTTSFNPGGVLNAIEYQHEVTEGEYIHMAIVPAPRQTGARIFLNSLDKPSSGVIIFHMNGKMYKLHPKGKAMLNATVGYPSSRQDEIGEMTVDKLTKIFQNLKRDGISRDHLEGVYKDEPKVRQALDAVYNSKENAGINNEDYQVGEEVFIKGADHKKGETGTWRNFEVKFTEPANYQGAGWWAKIVKKNEGGDDMTLTEEQKKAAEEKAAKEAEAKKNEEEAAKKKEEENKSKENEAVEIDPETAVIETPEGEVSLKELVDTYQAEQVEIKKKEELEAANKKNEEGDKPKISIDDEFDGVPIKTMYEAYKKNKSAKKNEEDENAKKLASRRAALKSEGKSDEEIEEIIKNEAEAAKGEEKVNHFNSMKSLKNKPVEAGELKSRLSTREKIAAAKAEY